MRVGMGSGNSTDGYDTGSEVPVTIDYGNGGDGGDGGFWGFLDNIVGTFGGAQLPNGQTIVQGSDGKYYIRYSNGTMAPYPGGTPTTTGNGISSGTMNMMLLFGAAMVMITMVKK